MNHVSRHCSPSRLSLLTLGLLAANCAAASASTTPKKSTRHDATSDGTGAVSIANINTGVGGGMNLNGINLAGAGTSEVSSTIISAASKLGAAAGDAKTTLASTRAAIGSGTSVAAGSP